MIKYIFAKSLLLCSLVVGLNAEFLRDDAKNIVTDTKTGLMWQDNAVGSTMVWNSAITTCENLTLGGYDDWRLPNIRELKSIVDRSRVTPSISPVFKHTASKYYWSSTTDARSTDSVLYVDFYDANGNIYNKTNSSYIRCVRAGQ